MIDNTSSFPFMNTIHDIGMAIAMCHFEVSAMEPGMLDKWKKKSPNFLDSVLEYIMTRTAPDSSSHA